MLIINHHQTIVRYLEEQRIFKEKDLVFDDDTNIGRVVRWYNILDRGHCAKDGSMEIGETDSLQCSCLSIH